MAKNTTLRQRITLKALARLKGNVRTTSDYAYRDLLRKKLKGL